MYPNMKHYFSIKIRKIFSIIEKHLPLTLGFLLICNLSFVNAEAIRFEGVDIPDFSGKVVTVSGPIEPRELGSTLMHEHLFIDFWLPLNKPDRWKLLGMKYPITPEEMKIRNMLFNSDTRAELLAQPMPMLNRDAFKQYSLSAEQVFESGVIQILENHKKFRN